MAPFILILPFPLPFQKEGLALLIGCNHPPCHILGKSCELWCEPRMERGGRSDHGSKGNLSSSYSFWAPGISSPFTLSMLVPQGTEVFLLIYMSTVKSRRVKMPNMVGICFIFLRKRLQLQKSFSLHFPFAGPMTLKTNLPFSVVGGRKF